MADHIPTDWTPLKGGGANFQTHKLAIADESVATFKPAGGAIAFYLVFLLTGLGLLAAAVVPFIRDSLPELMVTIMLSSVGLAFTLAGSLMFYFGSMPIVFDRSRGFHWKGRKDPDEVWNRSELNHFVEIDDVAYLQLLGEYISGSGKSRGYHSYELNLVLKDGTRRNVTDHGKLKRIAADAQELAAFLEIPLLSTPESDETPEV